MKVTLDRRIAVPKALRRGLPTIAIMGGGLGQSAQEAVWKSEISNLRFQFVNHIVREQAVAGGERSIPQPPTRRAGLRILAVNRLSIINYFVKCFESDFAR